MASTLATISRARPGPAVSNLKPAMSIGLSALWYVAVVLPDAQISIHREWHRKDINFWDPRRLVSLLFSVGLIASLPASLALRTAGRPRASKVAASGVMLNLPTVLIVGVVASEAAMRLAVKLRGIVGAFANLCRGKQRNSV
jgi:hypothetical protein